jgi:hypothetical protein
MIQDIGGDWAASDNTVSHTLPHTVPKVATDLTLLVGVQYFTWGILILFPNALHISHPQKP